jgi:hypothetical protein
MSNSQAHNAAIFPLLKAIVEAEPDEAGQWVLLETLCLGIGRLHGRSDRDTAEFIDAMSERIATGARDT